MEFRQDGPPRNLFFEHLLLTIWGGRSLAVVWSVFKKVTFDSWSWIRSEIQFLLVSYCEVWLEVDVLENGKNLFSSLMFESTGILYQKMFFFQYFIVQAQSNEFVIVWDVFSLKFFPLPQSQFVFSAKPVAPLIPKLMKIVCGAFNGVLSKRQLIARLLKFCQLLLLLLSCNAESV